jgi:soluble P-type ATPase
MKDDTIKLKAIKLKELVKEVNKLMDELGQMNVDVRIGYVERKGDVPQGIHVWRIEEHNDYLTDE